MIFYEEGIYIFVFLNQVKFVLQMLFDVVVFINSYQGVFIVRVERQFYFNFFFYFYEEFILYEVIVDNQFVVLYILQYFGI